MSEQDEVLLAYHRSIARARSRSGVSWPLTRADCCREDGTITDTNRFEPQLVANWMRDTLGRVRVRLV